MLYALPARKLVALQEVYGNVDESDEDCTYFYASNQSDQRENCSQEKACGMISNWYPFSLLGFND
jgi:hypothetical protein